MERHASFRGAARQHPLMRSVVAAVLIVAGLLACGYGVLLWVSIPTSDTATSSLVAFGATFAGPGLAAVGAGAWLARQRS
jgi:hypothetical protein